QWNRFARTQLDSANGTTESRDTFVEKTGWALADLKGVRVLDAGCGMGRRNPEWRWLDTFDWYAPKYQWEHSGEKVERWVRAAGREGVRRYSFPVSVSGHRPPAAAATVASSLAAATR